MLIPIPEKLLRAESQLWTTITKSTTNPQRIVTHKLHYLKSSKTMSHRITSTRQVRTKLRTVPIRAIQLLLDKRQLHRVYHCSQALHGTRRHLHETCAPGTISNRPKDEGIRESGNRQIAGTTDDGARTENTGLANFDLFLKRRNLPILCRLWKSERCNKTRLVPYSTDE